VVVEPSADIPNAVELDARISKLGERFGDDRERILAAARNGDLDREEPEVSAALFIIGALGWPQADSVEARELVERALEVLRRTHDAARRVRAMCGFAEYLASEGAHEGAGRLLEEALVDAGRRETAVVLLTRGNLLAARREFDAAISNFRDLLAIARELGDPAIEKHALAELGGVLSFAHRPVDALKVFMQLRALGDALGDTHIQISAWAGLGRVHRELGDLRKALDAAHKELELSGALKSDPRAPEARAIALHAIGLLHLDLGDPHEALSRFDEALTIEDERESIEGRIRVLHDMGTAHLALGAIDRARRCLRVAVALSRAVGDEYRYAHALNGLGAIEERAGELQRAEKLYARAIEAYEVSRDTQGRAVALSNRGRMLESLGVRDQALDLFVAARDEFARIGNEWAVAAQDSIIGSTLVELGDGRGFDYIALARNRLRDLGNRQGAFIATSNLAGGLAQWPELHDGTVEEAVAISTGEALALVAQASDDAAFGALSADDYSTLRATVTAVVAGAARHAWEDQELALISCYRAWAAVDLTWNMAARLQVERDLTAATSAAPDLALRIARLRAAQARLVNLRRAAVATNPEVVTDTAQRASVLADARNEVRRIEGELQRTLFAERVQLLLEGADTEPDLAVLGESFLRALRALNRDDVAIVAYISTEELSYAFVSTPGRVVLRPLPANGYQLAALSRLLTWGLEENGHRYGAGELHRILIATVADVVGARDLLIVPDEALADLPFGALDPRVNDDSGGGNLAEIWHLLQEMRGATQLKRTALNAQLEREAEPLRSIDAAAALFDLRAVTVCPSIATAHALAGNNDFALLRGRDSARFIGIADPTRLTSDTAPEPDLWPLKHARSEVRTAAALLGGDHEILEGENATRDGLSAAIARYAVDEMAHIDVMHFAAHGIEVARDPDDPSLGAEVAIVLADGLLTALDLAQLKVRNFVTSLLCCHSRRGSAPSRWVDESGLSLGFHLAGATYVVSCTSSVPDASTEELATRFYKHLVAGEGPAHALAAAQREVRDMYAHASAWAPFVVSGPPDPQATK
jgi:tetratricopeptide (TPR) repeat protein